MRAAAAISIFLCAACNDGTSAPHFNLSCEPTLAAVATNDGIALRAEPDRPLHSTDIVVLAPPSARALPDIATLMNQLEGWGLRTQLVTPSELAATSTPAMFIVASSAYEGLVLDTASLDRIETSCQAGTDFVWLGLGIPDRLYDELGASAAPAMSTSALGISAVHWAPPLAQPLDLVLDPEEFVEPLTSMGAEVLAQLNDGRALLTTNRGLCRATALPFAFGDYWAESGDAYAWVRAEMLHEAIEQTTSQGTASLELFPAGTTSMAMVRLEDVHPGGTRFSIANEFFVYRLERVLGFLRDRDVHLNLSVVTRYVDPQMSEDFGWLDPDDGRATLLATLQRAIAENGAALIAHGFTHQYGTRENDYTGVDYEMSDDASGQWVFLPYDSQRTRIAAARAELTEVFGFAPRTWETPHLDGNADTYRAVADEGFDIVNEEDGNLFPHVMAFSSAVNVPHTGSYVPSGGGAGVWAQNALMHVMPRMFRLGAPFFFFYHNYNDEQEAGLTSVVDCAWEAGAWGPNVEELVDRWSARQTATMSTAHVDGATMRVTITGAPANALLRVRLPEGHVAREVRVDGATTPFEDIRRGGIAFARVALAGTSATVDVVHGP